MTSGGIKGTIVVIIYGNSKRFACFGFPTLSLFFYLLSSPLLMNVHGKRRSRLKVNQNRKSLWFFYAPLFRTS